jgi:hypothetical protein
VAYHSHWMKADSTSTEHSDPPKWEPLPPKAFTFVTERSRKCKAGWLFLPTIVVPTIIGVGGYFYIGSSLQWVSGCPSKDGGSLSRIFSTVFATSLAGVGPLSFVAAKGIDVAWDLIVGRGGQLVLFWIASCVYTAVLNQVLEATNVSHDLYISAAISSSSLGVIRALVRRLFTTAAFWPKMCFMLYSALYVAGFPTLIAAMTSYIAMSVPMVETHNGTLAKLDWYFSYGSNILIDGTLYSNDYVLDHCTDNTQSDRYLYAIAVWIWVALCVLQSIWSFGMYGLWVDACRKSRLHQAGRRLGLYRGILDIAEALQNDLGPDTCAYSEAELEKAIKERSSGYGLSYRLIHRQSTTHLTISQSKICGDSPLILKSGDLYGSIREEVV